MSSSLRRGALAASAIVFSIASLAACGAGNNSQTLEIKPDNAATTVGNIKVENALVITQPDLKSTGPAVVSGTLFNQGATPETLQSITVDGSGTSAQLKPAKGQSLTIAPHTSLILGGKGNASAVLPSGREAVQDGNAQKITFTFDKAGAVSLRAFVVPASSYFTDWGPSQIPSTAPTGSPAAGSTATATGKPGNKAPKGKASGTPSGSASQSSGANGVTPSDSASQSAAGQ